MSQPDIANELQRTAALIEMNRCHDAVMGAQRVLATDPGNVRAACLLAQAQLGLGNAEDAAKAAQTAIALGPNDDWPYRLASIAQLRAGRNGQAVLYAREAVRLAPEGFRSHIVLADSLLAHNEIESACRHAARAVELAPDSAETHYAAGRAAAASGRADEAREAYKRSLAINPDYSPAHNGLARLDLQGSKVFKSAAMAKAATGFGTALRSDPRAAVSRRNLDIVLIAFLRRTAYFVFIAGLLGAETGSSNTSLFWRAVPAVVLLIPALIAVVFVIRLPRALRSYLRDAVLHRPQLRAAVLLELAAAACLVGLALTSRHDSPIFGIAAFVAAALARIQLKTHAQRTARGQA